MYKEIETLKTFVRNEPIAQMVREELNEMIQQISLRAVQYRSALIASNALLGIDGDNEIYGEQIESTRHAVSVLIHTME